MGGGLWKLQRTPQPQATLGMAMPVIWEEQTILFLQKLGTEPSFLLPRHLQDVLYQKPPVPSQPPENTYLEAIFLA